MDLDFDSAMDEVAKGLDLEEEGGEESAPFEQAKAPEATEAPVVDELPMPQSWKKEWEPHWKASPAEARKAFVEREKQMLDGLEQYKGDAGFGRSLREVFNPYGEFLKSQGVDEVKAAQYLLNAHYRLTNGSPEDKAAYWSQLAKSYGIQAPTDPNAPAPAALPPEVQDALQRLAKIEGTLTEQQQRDFAAKKAQTRQEIDKFADDPKHPYFDECADHIGNLIKAGYSLQDAYDTAVYANPVTRAKELQRLQTEAQASLKEKAKQTAKAARKATSANVNSTSSTRTPTEPAGTMDDILRESLSEIKSRAH